jgi:hypothetical protein
MAVRFDEQQDHARYFEQILFDDHHESFEKERKVRVTDVISVHN